MLCKPNWALPSLLLIAAAGCDETPVATQSKATASASAVASAAPVRRARFVHRAVSVGQRWRRQRKSRMKVSVEFWTETSRWATADSLREEEMSVTDEIKKRVGSWPGEVLATYAVHHVVEQHPDKGKRDERLLEGRAFILNRVDEQPLTTDAEGKEVTEEERQALWGHHTQLGKEDELIAILTQRPIPVGREYPLKGFMFTALLGAEMGEYKSGHFTITDVAERSGESVATFSWTAALQSKEDNGMVMDWDLKGTTYVALEPARLISQDIEATIAISGRARKDGTWLRIEGAGAMQDHREQAVVE